MRTRRAIEEHADRERDRDDDAADDAEHEHAAEGDERERHLGRADVSQAPDRAELISPAAATTMITPSAAVGNGSISGIAKSRKSPTTAAATRTAAWDFAPAASLTADRELEEETGNAPVRPPTRLAPPIAVSSRLASTS